MESGVQLDPTQMDDMMKAYDNLSTFPDVPPALKKLVNDDSVTAVVFSNGTQNMVTNSVTQSSDLAPHANVFQDIIVVSDTKRFKPQHEVYHYLAAKVGKKMSQTNEMWLVSGNPFDIVGAKAVGMNAAWVDRAGQGWQDQLIQGEAGKPTIILSGLEDVVEKVKAHAPGSWP